VLHFGGIVLVLRSIRTIVLYSFPETGKKVHRVSGLISLLLRAECTLSRESTCTSTLVLVPVVLKAWQMTDEGHWLLLEYYLFLHKYRYSYKYGLKINVNHWIELSSEKLWKPACNISLIGFQGLCS
jgi:hypothetical protein